MKLSNNYKFFLLKSNQVAINLKIKQWKKLKKSLLIQTEALSQSLRTLSILMNMKISYLNKKKHNFETLLNDKIISLLFKLQADTSMMDRTFSIFIKANVGRA